MSLYLKMYVNFQNLLNNLLIWQKATYIPCQDILAQNSDGPPMVPITNVVVKNLTWFDNLIYDHHTRVAMKTVTHE